MAVKTWTVDELCSAVGDALRAVFPDELWIRGQISGLRRSPAGHVYFDLIEPGARGKGADMRISVVAFRGPLRGIEAVLAKVGNLQLEDGIEVRIRGRVDYYPPQGRVQFMMNAIDPRYTLGQLAADRDEVMRSLAADGLLDANKRHDLALVPLRIGLITSDDSAAYNDFVEELQQSPYPFEIVLADARVQGLDAEASLVAAFGRLSTRRLDVIALVRGGGARTDLVAFDRENVARAVAKSPVPVFVGIGHEIDRAVVDEICHSSLKTPTACAAALIARVRSFDDRLSQLSTAIATRATHRLVRADERIDRGAQHLARSTLASVRLQTQQLDNMSKRLGSAAVHTIAGAQHRLGGAAHTLSRTEHDMQRADGRLSEIAARLGPTTQRILAEHHRRLTGAEQVADALHPDRTLARGFSITRLATGEVVRSTPSADALIVTETAATIIDSRVVTTHTKEDT
ncbi:MAG: exodeoxyribonuclease VII large subunit [Actinomycetota bacterium]|nr:exodeoxyribonuclease VII large subunit [Actinomycetota bacterium]